MKEVIIDGVVYVPKVIEGKKLKLNVEDFPILSNTGREKWNNYYDVLRICEYLNNEFKSDGDKWVIDKHGITASTIGGIASVFHFTSVKAAKFALLHFKETFKTFYS